MKKSLVALAFGTLGLGIAEFVMMAILPDVAKELNVSIASAGHLISAYALGVCTGAPLLILARKHQLKYILMVLVVFMMLGNIGASLAPNYWTLMLARFISGLPHGAYFGVGSIVAEKLANKGKGAQAISIMVTGMTVANLLGVPLGSWISVAVSWRATFMIVGFWSAITLYYIWIWVPKVENLPDTGFKGQFRFLKSLAPWLLIGATVLGNAGVFSWYSYINPLLVKISGFAPQSITSLMLLAGAGMVIGNLTTGRIADRYPPGRVAAIVQGGICAVLLMIFLFSPIPWASALLLFLCTTGLFALSSPQQLLLIRYSKGGELLGAASVQIAFNLGNAIGAYCGGLTLQAGLDYRYPSLVGVPFALMGSILLLIFYRRYEAVRNSGRLI